jgi:hypothetical protein
MIDCSIRDVTVYEALPFEENRLIESSATPAGTPPAITKNQAISVL